MDYERVHVSDDPAHDMRYRERTLQRWRMSMFASFIAGVVCTAALYPKLSPCPNASVIAKAAASNCPACPSCPTCAAPDTHSIVHRAVRVLSGSAEKSVRASRRIVHVHRSAHGNY